jgi:phage terminase large subunit GpA-like protein
LTDLNVIYFFPTRTDVLDFSRSRVTPLLDENPFLQRLMTDTDTVGLKRIGNAHLYMRGMQSTVGMKSVPADLVIFDELDEAAPAAIRAQSESETRAVIDVFRATGLRPNRNALFWQIAPLWQTTASIV